LRLFNAELFSNDFFDTQFDIAHGFPLRVVNKTAILTGRTDRMNSVCVLLIGRL